MKHLFLAVISSFFLHSAFANNTVVAVSPHQTQATAKQLFTDIFRLYTQAELGSSITVINASDGTSVATLKVPENKNFNPPKARIRLAAREIRTLQRFINGLSQGEHRLGAMDAPFILHQIGRAFPHASDIVLMGSHLYMQNSQRDASMVAENDSILVGTDVLLLENSTQNPYGTKDKHNTLLGKRVHWLMPVAFKDGVHSQAITRFWHLFIHQQSGKLVSLTTNREAVLNLLLSNAPALPMHYTLDKTSKRGMQHIRSHAQPTTSVKPASSVTPNKVQPKPTLAPKQTLSIVMNWQGGPNTDIDLHAQALGDKRLYYRDQHSAIGFHKKDERSSAENAGWQSETITFYEKVDIRTLVIAINVFSVPAGTQAIQGTLQVKFNNKHYHTPFHFAVNKGNGGKDTLAVMQSGADSQYTQHFSVQDVIGDNVTIAEVLDEPAAD